MVFMVPKKKALQSFNREYLDPLGLNFFSLGSRVSGSVFSGVLCRLHQVTKLLEGSRFWSRVWCSEPIFF